MANDRLRDALMAARVTHEDLAADLGVHTKTVERWITQDRTPYPQFRHRISVLVQKDETLAVAGRLLTQAARRDRPSQRSCTIYPYRADVPRRAVGQAVRERDRQHRHPGLLRVLPAPSSTHPHIELLKQKADDGASIRILLGDPDSPQVALKGQEEDIGDAIAAKIRNVLLAYYSPSPAIRASASSCTPRRCTTRSSGSTTTCWSTPTSTASPRTSPRSCTCGTSAPGPSSRPTPAASTGCGTRPARPGPARRGYDHG